MQGQLIHPSKLIKKEKTMDKIERLQLLRKPFPANQIGKLPKPTKQQTMEVKNDFKKGIRCQECGQWHHPKVVHLDYVGHAALTDRFLDVDPEWNWEPFAVDCNGLPALDNDGLLWIRLTICGVTRIGVGDAAGKTGGDAMKERIGDALRNAGMRFGAALDLWHKGDLHDNQHSLELQGDQPTPPPQTEKKETITNSPSDEKPLYPDSRIEQNLPKWKTAIKSGQMTTDDIIEKIGAFYSLTNEQKERISNTTGE
jgi:hypothetical protein